MISNKNAILFLMVVAFGTADGRFLGAGMRLCSEAIGDITSCVAQNCPETTMAGYVDSCPEVVDADTCAELQIICDAYADCCGACGEEIKELLNQCTPGDEGGTCNIVTCGTAAAAEPEAEAEPEGSLCSESIGAITSCVAQKCPEATKAGNCPSVDDADTCAEVQTICDGYADCCGACGEEMKNLLNQCTPGDEGGTCNLVTCGTAAAAEPEAEAEPEGSLCSESIGAITSCVAQKCPEATKAGNCPSVDDADTCAEVQTICDGYADCCGACGEEMKNLLNQCTPGDEGGTCNLVTCGTAAAAEPEAEAEPEGSLCSESIGAITSCVAQKCPEATKAGNCPSVDDADTCAEVQTICDGYADCCGACGEEMKNLLNQCTPGDEGGTCNLVTCGTAAAAEPEAEAEPEGSLCSESIGAITSCVAQKCPEATKAGNCPSVDDADTCAEVQTICDGYADCCGACGVEIAGLLNQCTPGQGGTCNVNSCGGSEAEQEPGTPDEDPTDPANIIQPAAVLTSIIAVVAAMVNGI